MIGFTGERLNIRPINLAIGKDRETYILFFLILSKIKSNICLKFKISGPPKLYTLPLKDLLLRTKYTIFHLIF